MQQSRETKLVGTCKSRLDLERIVDKLRCMRVFCPMDLGWSGHDLLRERPILTHLRKLPGRIVCEDLARSSVHVMMCLVRV
jgi:hypothetical protein